MNRGIIGISRSREFIGNSKFEELVKIYMFRLTPIGGDRGRCRGAS